MKIKYEFVNGEHSEIEVSEDFGRYILDSRRAEESNDRRYRMYNLSLGTIDYEGDEYAYEDDHSLLFSSVYTVMEKVLTRTEYRRMTLLIEGLNLTEIAMKENVSVEAVRLSISTAQKKIRERI
jgi:DNA-directed RNA polymerase specialized sigma24 family protein